MCACGSRRVRSQSERNRPIQTAAYWNLLPCVTRGLGQSHYTLFKSAQVLSTPNTILPKRKYIKMIGKYIKLCHWIKPTLTIKNMDLTSYEKLIKIIVLLYSKANKRIMFFYHICLVINKNALYTYFFPFILKRHYMHTLVITILINV